jgi:superfamily II DNA/RNA helicase
MANEFLHRNGRTARMHAKGTAYIILYRKDNLPDYINGKPEELPLSSKQKLPNAPQFKTLYLSGGKKNKLNKMDIVGSFLQKGKLHKSDLGLIEVKDFISYAAVKSEKVESLLMFMKEEKIKGKKYKIGVTR